MAKRPCLHLCNDLTLIRYMSGEKPTNPGEGYFERLARHLEATRIDPLLRSLFDQIPYEIDGIRDGMGQGQVTFLDIEEALGPLNDRLLGEWEDVVVTVTGKARIYDESFYKQKDSSELADDRGKFVLLPDKRFVCCGFGVSTDDDGGYDDGPIGLVIVPVEDYEGIENVDFTSALILLEEDMNDWSARFDKPSCRAIELEIRQASESLARMIAGASKSRVTDAARTRYLQKFKINKSYPELGTDYPLERNVSRYLYEEMDFDDEVPYEIVVEGHIRAVEQTDKIEPYELIDGSGRPVKQKISGYIEGVILEEDSEGHYAPTLVVATPVAKGGMGWNGLLIRASDICEPIRNTRPRRPALGGVALQAFGSREELEWFIYSELHPPQGDDADADERFEDIIANLEGDWWHDEVVYNTEKRRFETPLTGEIAVVLEDFERYLGEVNPDKPISDETIAQMLKRLKDETGPGLRFQPGDQIEVTGPVSIAGEIQGKGVGAHTLAGVYHGFDIVQISNSDLGIIDCRLTVVLSDCVFSDNSGEETGKGSEIQVFLSVGEQDTVKFVKIEPALE